MATQLAQPVLAEQPRVLVVEDEFIIAMDLAETVRDLGFTVDGPHSGKRTAMMALEQGMPDFAILDIFTDDGDVYPLADRLADAGVPIIFHSGHIPPDEVQQRYPQAQAASKPCAPGELIQMMQGALDHHTH